MMKIEENAAIDGPVGSAGGRSPSTRPTGQAPPILTAGIGLMPMLCGMGNWLLRPRRFRHGAAAAGGDVASEVALPSGAPCGGLDVSAACTLCLACTRACPTGALEGEPRSQVLTFQESACGPCGLCAAVCPEQAITLRPRLAPDAALRRVLVPDEVAICARCGRPCGGRRMIERVIARLRQVSPGLPQRGWSDCDPAIRAGSGAEPTWTVDCASSRSATMSQPMQPSCPGEPPQHAHGPGLRQRLGEGFEFDRTVGMVGGERGRAAEPTPAVVIPVLTRHETRLKRNARFAASRRLSG